MGSPKKSFKFCSDGICNNTNSLPECQKPAFLTFRKFRFSQGSMPPDPLLYYAPKGNFIPPKTRTFHFEKLTNLFSHFFIFFFVLSLSFFFFFFGGGEVISIILRYKGRPPQKSSYEEGRSSHTTGATRRIPPAPPPPLPQLKINGP